MAEFAESFLCLKPSLPFMEIMDPSFELMGHFAELNGTAMENSTVGPMGFSGENFLSHHPEFSMPFADNLSSLLPPAESATPMTPGPGPGQGQPAVASYGEKNIPPGDRKRKARAAPETSSANSSDPPTESCPRETDRSQEKKNGPGSAMRGRNDSKEVGAKPKEVVHVRARRGQATDSHSLAERVRREKINERMRHLQDLVPGCCKAMGMTGMLDEIINYVQSLQNQIEFLSMKLSAASSFHDYCLDLEALATPQLGNPYEARDVERARREGFGGCTGFHSTMPF